VVVLAGVAALALRSDGDVPAPESRRLPDGPDLVVERVPSSWRITYLVTTGAGSAASVVTEVVEVRRPFESRVETHLGDTASGEPASVQVSSFGRLRLAGAGGEPSVVAQPVGPPAGDLRIDRLLPDAAEEALLARREHREVAGRRCQVLRSDGPLGSGPLTPVGAASYADTCVDEAGLVLEEAVVVDGERIVHRIAVEVDEEADLPDGRFETGEPTAPPNQGGGSVLRMVAGSRPPGTFWVLDPADVPRGFEACGRFSVVPPQPESFSDPSRESSIVASTTDVWVSGPDLLLVDQGATLGGGAPFAIGERGRIDLGDLGTGEVLLDAGGNEVRVVLEAGGFVVVKGTLPVDRLVSVAKSLRAEPGGELEVDRDAALGCAG
jgi:hypothetical protein